MMIHVLIPHLLAGHRAEEIVQVVGIRIVLVRLKLRDPLSLRYFRVTVIENFLDGRGRYILIVFIRQRYETLACPRAAPVLCSGAVPAPGGKGREIQDVWGFVKGMLLRGGFN
jgi:hypothetical protein